jgi:hypothetical protein
LAYVFCSFGLSPRWPLWLIRPVIKVSEDFLAVNEVFGRLRAAATTLQFRVDMIELLVVLTKVSMPSSYRKKSIKRGSRQIKLRERFYRVG